MYNKIYLRDLLLVRAYGVYSESILASAWRIIIVIIDAHFNKPDKSLLIGVAAVIK